MGWRIIMEIYSVRRALRVGGPSTAHATSGIQLNLDSPPGRSTGVPTSVGFVVAQVLRYGGESDGSRRPLPANQLWGPCLPTLERMLKIIVRTGIGLAAIILLLLWGMQMGYKRGYADGSQSTNTWWIDKKGHQFETSEVIKKRLDKGHHTI